MVQSSGSDGDEIRPQQNIDLRGSTFYGSFAARDNSGKTTHQGAIAPPISPATPNNLPNSNAICFVGRDRELQDLHQMLNASENRTVAIAGMGGAGKTELALRYARWQQSYYSGGLVWLQGKRNLALEVIGYARSQFGIDPPEEMDPVQRAAFCWRQFSGNAPVLVVADDLADYGQARAYLPPDDPKFRVLLTRRKRFGKGVAVLSLALLAPEAALKLLEAAIGGDRTAAEPEAARELCRWLGYLPLGLELVGRFLDRRPDRTLAKMQERLESRRLQAKALARRDEEMTTEHENLVAAFELSWEGLSEAARELGCLLGLFAAAPIPWEMVVACWEDEEDLEDLRDDELVPLHLLQKLQPGIYELHPLLREYFRWKREERCDREGSAWGDRLVKKVWGAVVAIAKTIPQALTLQDVARVKGAIPHLEEMAGCWVGEIERADDMTSPFIGLGRFYEGQALYDRAEIWWEAGLVAARKQLGEEHPSVATSLNNLAVLYESQGRYEEAEPLYLQSLDIMHERLGEKHPDVATSLNNLAGLYRVQGRYEEAEPLFLQSLETRRKQLGEEHLDVATSLNNLARLYESQGRYEEAEPLYLQSLDIMHEQLGEEHPSVATSFNNLAALYESQGRYEEAEPLFLQSLETRLKQLGEEHPSVATSLNDLAGLYRAQGRYEEAEPLFLQSLDVMRKQLGEEHPSVATSLNNLAALCKSQGRYEEAEPLYLQSLDIMHKRLGEEHPSVATSLNGLAALYELQGRYEEAEPLYLQSLDIMYKRLGEEHPSVATSLNGLAALYELQGRYEEAEPLYLQSLDIMRKRLGEEHPSVAASLNNLAGLYYARGNYPESESFFLQALAASERLLGADHPHTKIARGNLEILRSRRES